MSQAVEPTTDRQHKTFRAPGGELTALSLVWIIGGIALIAYGVNMHHTMTKVMGWTLLIPSVGLWLGQRWFAYHLVFSFLFVATILVVNVIWIEETAYGRLMAIVKIVAIIYFAKVLITWLRSA